MAKKDAPSITCDNPYCKMMAGDSKAIKFVDNGKWWGFLCYSCFIKFRKSSRLWNASDADDCKVKEIENGRKITVPPGFNEYKREALSEVNNLFHWS